LRALRVQLDNVEIHGLFNPAAVFLMEENPYVDVVHRYEGALLKLWKLLRAQQFDIVVNLRHDWKTRAMVFLLGVRSLTPRSDRWRQWLMIHLKVNHLRNGHVVERMMDALEPLSVKMDELGLDYFIPERDKVSRSWLPEQLQNNYVVFSLAAPYATRKLPVDRMIELCDKINRPIILLGTTDDHETGELIHRFFDKGMSLVYEEGLLELNKKTTVYNACGKFNFNQMASVVKQASAVFMFDSDLIPVASALKKEIFGLWGNTILLFGRYPYRTKFSALESNSVMCRPCSSRGFDSCPKKHFKCMRDILFDFYLS
jgi:ADP-heptose:LPS heptosyltransferase